MDKVRPMAADEAAAPGAGAAMAAHVRKRGIKRLWTHASLIAEPAFAARGFHVIARQTVERSVETLDSTKMEKVLT